MSDLIHFSSDMTLHWSFSRNDLLIWLRWQDIFSGSTVQIIDVWQMRNEDNVTITNRIEDLPQWFKLHPTEASGILSHKMLSLLGNGYPSPPGPLAGPNIWRPAGGDRLVWISQISHDEKGPNGILSIINFDQCALVLGEPHTQRADTFGSLNKDEIDPIKLTQCKHYAVEAVKQMGIPRRMRFKWGLGS